MDELSSNELITTYQLTIAKQVSSSKLALGDKKEDVVDDRLNFQSYVDYLCLSKGSEGS